MLSDLKIQNTYENGKTVIWIQQYKYSPWKWEYQRQISYGTSMDWIYITIKNKIMKTAVKCFFKILENIYTAPSPQT